MDNTTIAKQLLAYANYLEGREANLYRIRAYRKAAEAVAAWEQSVAQVLEQEGRSGLEALPGIGSHLSYSIEALVRTGDLRAFTHAERHIDPERLLTTVPGVGSRLARQIHDGLGISTLEELECAAHDGRLGTLGIGPKRLRGIVDSLAVRLASLRRAQPPANEPSVADLLAVDQEYRGQAQQNRLPRTAPRRFNAQNEPWLPLYQTRRGVWRCRALFSNSALAHRLRTTHDWVVVYFTDGVRSGQRTIVTETRGDLRGRRVVRGREQECRQEYTDVSSATPTQRPAIMPPNVH